MTTSIPALLPTPALLLPATCPAAAQLAASLLPLSRLSLVHARADVHGSAAIPLGRVAASTSASLLRSGSGSAGPSAALSAANGAGARSSSVRCRAAEGRHVTGDGAIAGGVAGWVGGAGTGRPACALGWRNRCWFFICAGGDRWRRAGGGTVEGMEW